MRCMHFKEEEEGEEKERKKEWNLDNLIYLKKDNVAFIIGCSISLILLSTLRIIYITHSMANASISVIPN